MSFWWCLSIDLMMTNQSCHLWWDESSLLVLSDDDCLLLFICSFWPGRFDLGSMQVWCLIDQSVSWLYLPLGAVGMAGMAFIVGFCILEDETVGTLQAIRTFFNTIRTVFKIEAFHTILWALWGVKKKEALVSISELIHGMLT